MRMGAATRPGLPRSATAPRAGENGIGCFRTWVPSPAVTLFLCMFAAQAAVFVLAPILPRIAEEFTVPIAAVGQLRAISGLVAGITTLALGTLAWQLSLRDLIAAGLLLVGLGSLVAALALDFAMLVVAHVALGVGLGVVLSAAVAATAQWAPPGSRTGTLSWALMGPPAAAILGTLGAGLLADLSWRAAWLAVPFASSILALAAVRTRPPGNHAGSERVSLRQVWRLPAISGWLVGELLAYSAWSAIPVYAAAQLIQSYGSSAALAGLAVSASAAAFMIGNAVTRRWVGASLRSILLIAAVALAGTAGAFGAFRAGFWPSAALLALLGLLAGGRTLAGNAFGLRAAPGHGVAVMAARTTAQQFGYLVGAGLGGAALAIGGYGGLGVLLALLFVLAALPHARTISRGGTAETSDRAMD